MKLEPTNPNDIPALLKEAMYGFERDDTDGYEFAKRCVTRACALANPRFTYHLNDSLSRWHVYDGRLCIATTVVPGAADRIVQALTLYHKEDE